MLFVHHNIVHIQILLDINQVFQRCYYERKLQESAATICLKWIIVMLEEQIVNTKWFD